jgi:hypothetical protein
MPSPVTKKSITFANNRTASAALPASSSTAKEVVEALDLKGHSSVLLLVGGADSLEDKVKARLTQLLGRGVARAAITVNAAIVDGGTKAGVMELMGEGVAARGFKSPLIGVAPAGKVKYPGSSSGETELDPNHSHFVLVPGDNWGSETNMMFSLVNELSSNYRPVVALLVGGGAVAKSEALQVVRQNFPLLVVQGSGGVADEIATAWKAGPDTQEDPVMAEIVADGRIDLIQLEHSVREAERTVVRELGSDSVLMQAWDRFADYDSNATLQQRRFNKMQLAILVIGLVGTALAVGKQVFAYQSPPGTFITSIHGYWFSRSEVSDPAKDPWIGWWLLKYILILIPIVVTVLVTAANKFKQGNKWLLLRGGGETIKREIFRYRARAMEYSETVAPPPGGTNEAPTTTIARPNPEQVLAQRVEEISRRIMQTEVNSSSLVPYDKAKRFPPAISKLDDGFSLLTPDRYIQVRLDDQLGYYKKQAGRMERTVKRFQWTIYIIGGLGTLLAAINQQVWIALTTALTTAIATYLSYKQTENSLTKYNQSATNLANVKAWWTALPAEEQAKQTSVDSLVDHTEKVLQSELDGWVQQMQNSLANLRKDQPQAADSGASGSIVVKDDVAAAPPPAKEEGAGGAAAQTQETKTEPPVTPEQPEPTEEASTVSEEAKEDGDGLSVEEEDGLDDEAPQESQPDTPITGENGDGAANPNPEKVPPVSS